jgi:hypothetical protein
MKLILLLLCFDAGLGIIIPGINIYGNFSIFDALIIPLIVLMLITRRKNIKIKGPEIKYAILMFALGIWQLLSVIVGQGDIVAGLGPVVRTVYYCIIILLIGSEIKNKERMNLVLIATLLGIFSNLSYSMYLWTLNKRYLSGIIFLNNGLVNRNTLYYYSIFALPLLFYLNNMAQKKSHKIITMIGIVLSSIVIILTFSKGAWLLMIIAFSLEFFQYIKSRKIVKVLILISICISLAAMYNASSIIDAFTSLQLSDYSVVEDDRLDYKLFALQTGFEHPIFGIGTKNYRDYTFKYAPHAPTTDPHDVALMIFAESGVVALIIYILIQSYLISDLCKATRKIKKDKLNRNLRKLGRNLFILSITLSFLTGVIFTSKLFLVLIFIIIGITRVSKKVQENYINEELGSYSEDFTCD